MIRAGGHNDRVLPGAIHRDQSYAGGLRASSVNRADIDARRGKASLEMIAERIVSHPADHADLRRRAGEPGSGTGLVGAFAARRHLEVAAQNSLAGRGKPVHGNHEIHIEAADDDNRRHRVKSMPNFFSSSA